MNKVKEFIIKLWNELDPILELTIYITIAYTISKLVDISFMQATLIVFGYFVLNIIRILAVVIRDRFK